MKPKAVLVEDDVQQQVESTDAMRSAGFDVRVFADINSINEFLAENSELIDLFVLDRKLPYRSSDTASDELGDALFSDVRAKYPDARVLVFSGYTDFVHAQELMEGAGLLVAAKGRRIDRVSVLLKSQAVKFDGLLAELASFVDELDAVDIVGEAEDCFGPLALRALRRVAFEYGATSVRARTLSGGLTGAGVWQCAFQDKGLEVARVVVKQGSLAPPSGLQHVLPKEAIASQIGTVSGLMGGPAAQILQVAGDRPTSLSQLLGEDPTRAVAVLRQLITVLDGLPAASATVRLADYVSAFVEWEQLVDLLSVYGVAIPSKSLWISCSTRMSHFDLHASNILACENGPVLIDTDGSRNGFGLTDPVVMFFSSLTHPDSVLRGAKWADVEAISNLLGTDAFSASVTQSSWFQELHDWINRRSGSRREYWAAVLSYAARQLRYEDVISDPETRDRVVAICRKASSELSGV